MGKVKIKLQDICKSYYSETTVTQALHRINLSFSEGEFVAVTGESGSGKSTLLRIIGGMDTFDDGEMFVDGMPTFQYDEQEWEEYRRNKIGYVFQDYSLLGHYSALANITSALLAMGCGREQADETAAKYLERVGLKGYENQKASKLSSGQKQRLSIARALAKNTGILLADEPTGNLDSETGEQIIRLLRDLSEERLVIMVTHNYEQAEPYVTRKIRLHDGIVVSDTYIDSEKSSEKEQGGEKEGQQSDREAKLLNSFLCENKKKEFRFQNQVAAYLACMNCRSQKGRAFLFSAFLFVVSVVSFLFIGELYLHADDTFTKEYSTVAFQKKSSERLVVKRSDNKELTEEDFDKISSLSAVETVDLCGYANDINFYLEEGVDYRYRYGNMVGRSGREFRLVDFLNKDKYMMSTDCISEKDLRKGRMPESRNEIILYSADEKVLGSELMCYFQAVNIWGPNEYYGKELTVVGLLKEETEQVYFTRDLCNMLSLHMDYGEYHVYWKYDSDYGDYRNKDAYIPMISEDLEGKNARLSFQTWDWTNGRGVGPSGDVLFHFDEYGREGKPTGKTREQPLYIYLPPEDCHDMTQNILEVSEEFFYKYYPKERKSIQAAVYITSYARTDSVIRKLEQIGYEAESTYRVSVTDYDEKLVNERMTILGIAILGLVAAFLAEILVLRSFMKIRIKDFKVLKFIGMKTEIVHRISYFEIFAYCFAALAVTVAVMWILRVAGLSFLQEILMYYNLNAYMIFVVYNFAAGFLTVFLFNRLLNGRLHES